MNCQDYQETISAFVDAETSDIEAAALFRHLAECEDCRMYITRELKLREAIHHAQTEEDVPPPLALPDVRSAYTEADRAAAPSAKRGFRFAYRRSVRLPLLAVLFAVAASILASAYVTTTYFPKREVIEKHDQELVYIMELPQVEIKSRPAADKGLR